MEHFTSRRSLRQHVARIALLTVFISSVPAAYAAELLVNTENFYLIDDADTANIELRFGSSANEILRWDVTNGRFQFTDDVHVEGNITSSGSLTVDGAVQTKSNLTINSDSGAVDAVLTFGNASANQTLTFSNANQRFEFSDDVHVGGTLNVTGGATFGSTITIGGVTYTFPVADGSASGKVLATNGAGQLVWTDATDPNAISQSDADARYVNKSGDTMTGALTVQSTLSTTGNIATQSNLTINSDNGAANAVLTFGNDAGAETITFSDSTNQFEFSDDVSVTGNVNATGQVYTDGAVRAGGGLSGSTLNVDSGTVTINGVTYTFSGTQGGANQVLTNDGSGNLSWAAASSGVDNSSGGIVFLSPEYANAVYFGDGSSNVGRLMIDYDSTNKENYYRWQTTKGTSQDYSIAVRVRVPDNFAAWDSANPIQFRYRTGTANGAENDIDITMLDTANSAVTLTGGSNLTNTSWTTANITGPQASGTYTPGSYVTVIVTLTATSAGTVDAGYLEFNWSTTTP